LPPRERCFAAIGEDLDVELVQSESKLEDEPKRLLWRDGYLEEHFLRQQDVDFTLTNRSGRNRDVYIRLRAVVNARVEGADGVDFDEQTGPIAIFDLPAAVSQRPHHLTVVEGLVSTTNGRALRSEDLDRLAGTATLPDADRQIAGSAARKQEAVEQVIAELATVQTEIDTVHEDIERLRGHLQAMVEQPAGADSPILTRLLAVEDRLTELREKKMGLEADLETHYVSIAELLATLPEPASEPAETAAPE
jgi:hypothetical protein